MKKLFKNKLINKIGELVYTHRLLLVSFVFFFLFSFTIRVFATPLYNPGDTLSPTCAPGDTDCTVDIGGFTLPTLTTGSVLFSNGTTISQDNSNFFYNSTDHRLGIGTASPSTFLHVIGVTEQQRLGYDINNYLSTTVNSSGSTTFSLTGTTPKFTFSQGVKLSSVTPSTLIYSDSSREVVSLANSAGILTNDGSGGLSWAAGSSSALTSTYVGFGNGSNLLSGSSNLTFSSNSLYVAGMRIGIGDSSLLGSANTLLGYQAGQALNGSSTNNTIIGYQAGKVMTGVATNNTLVGVLAGDSITSGQRNNFMGVQSGHATTTGSYNTYNGEGSGYNSNGNYNVAFGYQAGGTMGDWNTILGTADTLKTYGSYNTVVGAKINIGVVSNYVVLGDGTGQIRTQSTGQGLWSQLYDTSNYLTTTVGSTGAVSYNAVGTGASFAYSDTADRLTSGNYFSISSTSTGAASNTQKLFNLSLSGANATTTQTTYGGYISNTHTGTLSTNVGLFVSASGGSNNYAAVFPSGYVGIGTATPSTNLNIYSSNPDMLLLDYANSQAGNGAAIVFKDNNGNQAKIKAILGGNLTFQSGAGAEFVRISSSGFMGIGNDNPALMLHVGSSAVVNSTNLLRLEDANSTCDFNADTGAPSCGSDITLKKNINDLSGNLEKVLALRPITYNWLTDKDGAQIQHGFIAQEVAEVMPELVHDGEWVDGTTRKFLQIAGMTPYIVGAIKDLDLKVEGLTSLDTESTGTFGYLMKTFLADASNTIENIFTKRITTKEICVDADTCLSEQDIRDLINTVHNGSSSSSGSSSGSGSEAGTGAGSGTGESNTGSGSGTAGDSTIDDSSGTPAGDSGLVDDGSNTQSDSNNNLDTPYVDPSTLIIEEVPVN